MPTRKIRSSRPIAWAAVCTSVNWLSSSGLFGLTRTAIGLAFGTSSCKSSSRFPFECSDKHIHPRCVAARPGKAGKRPSLTGSTPLMKTKGIVFAAAWPTQRAAHSDFRPTTETYGDVLTFDVSNLCRTRWNPATSGADSWGERLLIKPITGFVGCCGRIVSGQTGAAAPSTLRKFTSPHQQPHVSGGHRTGEGCPLERG